ncbi:hypothetical protein AJ79_05973 [Helicocarpus griseus UAMH5409]|uniref:Activator of Hsp90 ATPase AHSA1-like N-terminal domain-containing protein n=1 Tax=Helicocarpus griseus UAMH5409 TaxID=1447875 RepID=A0A2B7XA11_9EURO|nr:hypothetical protein AJ79_05973 [Helicocarpus griseus UAMH5409]
MVLHNPNNWHWVNKDASAWTKDYLDKSLTTISAEENGVTAQIKKVVSIDGDVDVSQRKGKNMKVSMLLRLVNGFAPVIWPDFELRLRLSLGKTSDDEDVSGSINIPEVAHDTEEDEYVFEIGIYAESASKQSVKDLVRSKLVPQIRKALAQLAPALITEHGKDIQHAPGSNPSSGFATPTQHVQSNTQTPRTSTPSTATTRTSTVNTTTVTATDEFRTTAEELYTTFTDPQRIAAFTRAPPRQFDGAKVGGKFSIFDGNVEGEYVKLDEPKQIVQKWRLAQWPQGHHSTLEINFDQNNVDQVTNMRVEWKGVPVGQEDVVRRNWEGYYVRSIKQTFGYV